MFAESPFYRGKGIGRRRGSYVVCLERGDRAGSAVGFAVAIVVVTLALATAVVITGERSAVPVMFGFGVAFRRRVSAAIYLRPHHVWEYCATAAMRQTSPLAKRAYSLLHLDAVIPSQKNPVYYRIPCTQWSVIHASMCRSVKRQRLYTKVIVQVRRFFSAHRSRNAIFGSSRLFGGHSDRSLRPTKIPNYCIAQRSVHPTKSPRRSGFGALLYLRTASST